MFNERGESIINEEFPFESGSTITGILYFDPSIYMIQHDGTITKIREDLNRSTASIADIQSDSIYPGYVVKDDTLMLANSRKGIMLNALDSCY